jgi:GDP-fucose protein O-fucosyltransferase
MSMETVLAMAYAMGRTLVLPPEKVFYLLGTQKGKAGEQRSEFSFSHFFHMESIHNEHPGLDIVTMKEFLEQEAMTGNLHDEQGNVVFPPHNQTNWDGKPLKPLFQFLRSTGYMAIWTPEKCMAAFPASATPFDAQALWNVKKEVDSSGGFPTYEAYIGKPFPVNASAKERMMENWADRKTLCLYDHELQNKQLIHFPSDHALQARLLVHFYAFLFFQDWRQDLFMKRFIRDHVRYVDNIQCAAARVIQAVRERARKNPVVGNDNPNGEYDAFHIRRGDFQYKPTRVDAPAIYEVSKSKLRIGETVYIATDERDKAFFQPLRDKYDIVFLDDFHDVLGDVNSNFYGMIDQLVASRSRTFFGCWFSTFTGYINRLRGYHSTHDKAPGHEKGIHNSWYYALEDRYDHLQIYYPVKREFYAREFPTSWRLIDTGIGELM